MASVLWLVWLGGMSKDSVQDLRRRFYRGRVGLTAILNGLNVGSGDEIITQAYTCVAVPEGVMASGATPVYTDITSGGVNIDPGVLERRISDHTKAIIVQHTFGFPADITSISRIAEKYRIPLIEDCCHTLTSRHAGRLVGTFGVGAFYSFEWGKPLACGVGGAIAINDETLARNVDVAMQTFTDASISKALRVAIQYLAFSVLYRPANYWRLKDLFGHLSKLKVAEGNYNPIDADMPSEEFGLCMLPAVSKRLDKKLKALSQMTAVAAENTQEVARALQVAGLEPVNAMAGDTASLVRLPVSVSDKPRFLALAREHGVEVAEWYSTPVHPLKGEEYSMAHYLSGSCPVAELACDSMVSLPVINVGNSYIKKLKRLLRVYAS